jgi:hypothetical protein
MSVRRPYECLDCGRREWLVPREPKVYVEQGLSPEGLPNLDSIDSSLN